MTVELFEDGRGNRLDRLNLLQGQVVRPPSGGRLAVEGPGPLRGATNRVPSVLFDYSGEMLVAHRDLQLGRMRLIVLSVSARKSSASDDGLEALMRLMLLGRSHGR